MQKADMKNILKISEKMFPGALKHLQKNGLDVSNMSQNLERALELCDDYRKIFFRAPKMADPWRDSINEERMLLSLKNIKISDSFHGETCIVCNAHNAPPPDLKKLEDMDDNEKILYDAYLSIQKKIVVKKVNLKLFNLEGAYYFKCDECIRGRK